MYCSAGCAGIGNVLKGCSASPIAWSIASGGRPPGTPAPPAWAKASETGPPAIVVTTMITPRPLLAMPMAPTRIPDPFISSSSLSAVRPQERPQLRARSTPPDWIPCVTASSRLGVDRPCSAAGPDGPKRLAAVCADAQPLRARAMRLTTTDCLRVMAILSWNPTQCLSPTPLVYLNLQQCPEPIASFANLRAAVLRSC